jgi:hypothetical protein
MAALIDQATRRHLKQARQPTLLGAELTSAKEEAFVLMVMDGLAIAAAYVKAGFNSKASNAPLILFHKPHIQARASAILEARRTQGVVTLPEVTSMLKRVFAGALHDAEYSAAHNAAFSLARIYGHVTDRATLEVIRRPSRDPDAPSEQALASWVEALPALAGPGLEAPDMAPFQRLGPGPEALPEARGEGLPEALPEARGALKAPLRGPPAGPLGPDTLNWYQDTTKPHSNTVGPSGPGPQGPEFPNDFKGLGLDGVGVGGRPENGAPTEPVTGTPDGGARAGLLGPEPHGGARAELLGPEPPRVPAPRGDEEKRVPPQGLRVPIPPQEKEKKKPLSGAEKRKARAMKELFG